MEVSQKKLITRISVALVIFLSVGILDCTGTLAPNTAQRTQPYLLLVLYLIPYLIAGYNILYKAFKNCISGKIFDENFLMAVASLGAFATIAFPDTHPHMAEGAAVMIFFQLGEFAQDYAVDKSRASISAMLDIAPKRAVMLGTAGSVTVDPETVEVGSLIVIKPGERIPIDGVVVEGTSQLDTSALTGEAMGRSVSEGSEVFSGCLNTSGALTVRTTKEYAESTATRILELVERASQHKTHTERFITRFARVYTPCVVSIALILAIICPVLGLGPWNVWVLRSLTFLVVSCPCALVISIPLSFFAGIGSASRFGVLIKGSSYLEQLAQITTVVFDKTGTLTQGSFAVIKTEPTPGVSSHHLLNVAAHAERFSTHPIAQSVRAAAKVSDTDVQVSDFQEKSGLGVSAYVDGKHILVGNEKLLTSHNIAVPPKDHADTLLYVAEDTALLGSIVVADDIKPDAALTIQALHASGITRTIMLTGDYAKAAKNVADKLGISKVHAQLLPAEKVAQVEHLLAHNNTGKLAFVGDGINDAPALMRADVGIAMGALGSDAAIEAADIVLMEDKPSLIVKAVACARKTLHIVRENIVFILGTKFFVLALATCGIASMWLAVFADVGVTLIATVNAMRCLRAR